ncbi:pantoate--beta-alanine ligase [candidate division KSB1 bacterium]|nr:pantoate--beta-alanine ligase [candidate division KSB1 bacterium]
MLIVNAVEKMRSLADQYRNTGKTIALVPTMGFLHEGHLSLIRRARSEADVLVTSIFVNPIQFGPNEDLDKYPKDLQRDIILAQDAGTDVLFVPVAKEVYPENFQTFVNVKELTRGLCGKTRPNHFEGVTTVVAKLFHIVKPHVAVFGQKDAQQALVIKRMIDDLCFDVRMFISPIVREDDGLALSSRNKYLTPEQRRRAGILYKSLCLAREMIKNGEKDVSVIKKCMKKEITAQQGKVDYIEIVLPDTLQPVGELTGNILIALAVYIGETRLIDNMLLHLSG